MALVYDPMMRAVLDVGTVKLMIRGQVIKRHDGKRVQEVVEDENQLQRIDSSRIVGVYAV